MASVAPIRTAKTALCLIVNIANKFTPTVCTSFLLAKNKMQQVQGKRMLEKQNIQNITKQNVKNLNQEYVAKYKTSFSAEVKQILFLNAEKINYRS